MLRRPSREERRAQGLLGIGGFHGHRPGHSTALLLLSLPVVLSGCLPFLLGNAKVLRPGEMTLSMGAQGRTESLPAGVTQAGPAAAVVELRGGLPGDVMDAGFTVQAPWNLGWDLKLQVLRETTWVPAVAIRATLGVLQPSFGGSLLASKTLGKLTVTLMAGGDRTSERLWKNGGSPFSLDSENYVKDIGAWGVGAEYPVSNADDLFAGVVGWNPTTLSESPKTGLPFGVVEKPGFFFTAGLRVKWKIARPAPSKVTMTALRGYVLSDPGADRIEVGQPGIYRAIVLLDTYTKITADGKEVPRGELKQGRMVLIQGLALPQPSTFLARTIELE
jgi:hypothetical protein